jgi:hypothetical protein
MTTNDSSRKSRGDKPAKPSKDYPLTPHGNGQWCKKIRSCAYPDGKVWFFGTWDDPQAALQKYLDEKDDILAGRDPKRSQTGTNLVDLVNRFLTDRQQQVTEGANISREHFKDLRVDCGRLLDAMGRNVTVEALRPDDFARLRIKLAEGVSAKTLEGRIARLRSVFQFGVDTELYDSVRWGTQFKKPHKPQLERERIQVNGHQVEVGPRSGPSHLPRDGCVLQGVQFGTRLAGHVGAGPKRTRHPDFARRIGRRPVAAERSERHDRPENRNT